MTRQEFKTLVHRYEGGERFFGYIIFLSPLALALSFLVFVIVEYFKDPVTSFLVWFALIVAVLCGLFAWWGLRKIKRKFRDIFVITFDQNQITDRELINLIAEKMNCGKQKHESGLIILRSGGWQISYNVFIGRQTNELYANLRLDDNGGFLSWGMKKLKQQFLDAINAIESETQYKLAIELEAV